ncbi:hypothetical protein DAEQUDRAFT_213273 [Daedalea quercina L-15889]|uniref:Uncharacterized protein n=1 Tax=Daedalea quercina L-15889 TaxID=1314783 RepID=A0A165R2W5_9APHY|nr:hypothetical protein DAEQUDRAFT_213273 [Daedalea quercina L-15889]
MEKSTLNPVWIRLTFPLASAGAHLRGQRTVGDVYESDVPRLARSTEQRRSGIYIATLFKPSGADDAPNQELEVVVKSTAD